VISVYPTHQLQHMDLLSSAAFATADVSRGVSSGKIVRTSPGSRGLVVSADKIATVVSHPTIQICGAGSILSPSSWDAKSSDAFLPCDCDDTACTSKRFVFPSYCRASFCLFVTYLRSTRRSR